MADTGMMEERSLVVIGGGPAGLAAALAAREAGVKDILILERDKRLGGILNQCIHNGFGLHTFKEELTGPEYAARYINRVLEEKIEYITDAMVIDVNSDKIVTYMHGKVKQIRAGAVILAMGCRERPRGALNTPGYRPAGIYSAGTAQYYVNIEGRMPGKRCVILGSGDIGLIMARRMTLEGAKVLCVAEIQPYSGGLKRNIVQCLNDYDIPLLLSHTVVDIKGKERVEGIVIAKVDDKMQPIPGTEIEYECDTLLLSCGLLPENELSEKAGVKLSPVTGGPIVNESLESSVPGIFACGNVLHVHDLVDYVSGEAANAGERAAAYLSGELDESSPEDIILQGTDGVRYTVPVTVNVKRMKDLQTVRFRVGKVFGVSDIVVNADGKEIMKKRKRSLAPGEMEELILKKSVLEEVASSGAHTITIGVREVLQ